MKVARTFVVVLVPVVLLGGCSYDRPAAPPERPRPAVTTSTTTPFPGPEAWVPSPNEVEPQLKRAAADTIRALFSYEPGAGVVDAARERLGTLAAEPAIADKVEQLLDPAARAAADVLYPQMGGLAGNRASAMVVTRLRWQTGEALRSEVRTIDVRLARREGLWTVEDVASLGGEPVPVPTTLSPAARRVLEHPNIELPDSARWDIHSGLVIDRVLTVLSAIADGNQIRVGVLSSGHPQQVFGSAHTSNHIPGRAVDVWWIGAPVVEQVAAGGPLRSIVQQLLDDGVSELGSPFDLDGPGGANFANLVHQDHLHIGFDSA